MMREKMFTVNLLLKLLCKYLPNKFFFEKNENNKGVNYGSMKASRNISIDRVRGPLFK